MNVVLCIVGLIKQEETRSLGFESLGSTMLILL